MTPAQARKLSLPVIFIVALAVRLGLMCILQSYDMRSEWSFGQLYGGTAKCVALGEGFCSPYFSSPRPSAMTAPAYVYFIALIFYIFGVYSLKAAIAVEVFQSFIAAFTCIIFYRLGKAMFNKKVGTLVAIALAVYPPSIYFSIKQISPIILVVFLLALIMYHLLKIQENTLYRNIVMYGLLMGFAALVEPTVIPFFAFACVWLFFCGRVSRFTAIKYSIIMGLVALVCVLPWTIRNYVVFGKFVLIKSPMGMNLFGDNNPYGVTIGTTSDPIRHRRLLDPSVDEIENDRILLNKAITFIKDNPATYLKLTIRRIYSFWSFVNPHKNISYPVLRGISYGSSLILAAIGVMLARSKWRQLSLILCLFLSYPLIFYMTQVTQYRYRYPIEPFLILLASYALVELLERFRRKFLIARLSPTKSLT